MDGGAISPQFLRQGSAPDSRPDSDKSPSGAAAIVQSEVDNYIRKKRKQREYKACYPCRSRKVKCDQQVPCKSCIDRHHPEFCTYHPPSEEHPPAKRVDDGAQHIPMDPALGSSGRYGSLHQASPGSERQQPYSNTEDTVTIPREELDRLVNQVNSLAQALADVQSSVRHIGTNRTPESLPAETNAQDFIQTTIRARAPASDVGSVEPIEGFHASNDLGETIHVGGSSVPALIMALSKATNDGPEVSNLLGKSILPIFGLNNESATYPFVSLWDMQSPLSRIQDLAQSLPDDKECRMLIQNYREKAHVLFPGIVDIDKFQSDLDEFMFERAQATASGPLPTGLTEESIYGKSIHWCGLLFVALACGSQCTEGNRKTRDVMAQVFICCGFECMRLTNFFGHANLQTIQTLLVMGNVITNNMNAGVAWVLLGLTIRLAKGLGLHSRCPDSTPLPTRVFRSKLWWAILWQDSLLSITYDRASSNSALDRPHGFPSDLQGKGHHGLGYNECMYRLCRVGLDIVRERATPQDTPTILRRISEHKHELLEIMTQAAEHLKDSRKCTTHRDQVQHWALYLHMSYLHSELSRPALSPTGPSSELSRKHRQYCIDSLINAVEAFLGLQNVTPFAARSWAALHRGLSPALLLCILREPSRNEKARLLVQRFIQTLYDITADVNASELAGPLKRSMLALTKLMNAVPPANNSFGNVVSFPSSHQQQQPAIHASSALPVADIAQKDAAGWDSPGTKTSGLSPLAMLNNEDSPYAMMDAIIWGQKQSPGWGV